VRFSGSPPGRACPAIAGGWGWVFQEKGEGHRAQSAGQREVSGELGVPRKLNIVIPDLAIINVL